MALSAKQHLTRERDEMLLAWLRLRSKGLTASDIAARYGTTAEKVKQDTLAVRAADVEWAGFWGDAPATVPRAYWDSKAMCTAGRKASMNKVRKDGLKSKGRKA